jgi:benzoyl-CoA reductase/2-hydroxyglutaryl-CoA dehydratase subunit BcrC/BadD/HgdB
VHDAILRTNVARAAMRRLLALRRGAPRVRGAEVLPLLGAFWRLAPDDYAALANEAADVLSHRTPLEGPRVLLTGALVDGPAVHAVIESLGALVVAEPGPWGSDAPGEDVSPDGDPFTAIAERYRRAAIGPRTPVAAVQEGMRRMAHEVDAVVVLLPPDDIVFGWDYPAVRAWCETRQLPHLCLTADPCRALGAADVERLETLIASVTPRVEARHG